MATVVVMGVVMVMGTVVGMVMGMVMGMIGAGFERLWLPDMVALLRKKLLI